MVKELVSCTIAVDLVNFKTVEQFCSNLCAGASVQLDAFSGLRVISKSHQYHPKVTPLEQVANWLPVVHLVISNLKTYLLGIFHGESHQYMQDYVDEFVYRFNRQQWKSKSHSNFCRLQSTPKRVGAI